MSAFSISPLTNVPPPNADEFPNFIQWQNDGVNLGGPDADTIDCTDGVVATRGTGENSNVITLSATSAPPSAVSAGVLLLESNPDPPSAIATFNYATISGGDQLFPTVVVASEDWECPDGFLHFINEGVYRVVANGYIQADAEWPAGNSTFGCYVNDVIGVHARTHTQGDSNDSATRVLFTDQTILTATAGASMQIGVQALATNNAHGITFAGITLVIEKLA